MAVVGLGYSGTTIQLFKFWYAHSFLTDTDGMVHYGDWLSLQTPNRIKVVITKFIHLTMWITIDPIVSFY